jgi:hypothetical protein
MKQIASLISFDELHKLPEGTEFTACFTDTVKQALPPVILKKRDARNYAERALDGVQILGTDRDGVPHAILKGTAVFSLTTAEEPESSLSDPWRKFAAALGAPSAKTLDELEERAGHLLALFNQHCAEAQDVIQKHKLGRCGEDVVSVVCETLDQMLTGEWSGRLSPHFPVQPGTPGSEQRVSDE